MFWKKKKVQNNNGEVQNDSDNQLKNKNSESKKSLPAKQVVTEFTTQFNNELDSIHTIAKSNIADWHSYINTRNILPVTMSQRETAKSSSLPIPTVAFPSEFREVLEQLQEETKGKISFIQQQVSDDFEADDLLDEFIRRKFNTLVDDELKKYLDATKPAVSVSDIFANASTSMNKYSVKEEDIGDKSYSIKCKTCGAARLEENQYDNCFYCGSPLF